MRKTNSLTASWEGDGRGTEGPPMTVRVCGLKGVDGQNSAFPELNQLRAPDADVI